MEGLVPVLVMGLNGGVLAARLGSARLEEAAAPKMHAKTPEPAPCSTKHGTICEPAQAPSALEQAAQHHFTQQPQQASRPDW